MRYVLQQKLWAFGDHYTIWDEEQRPLYRVEGKIFAWGDDLVMRSEEGDEVARISQVLLTLRPTYEVRRGGVVAARVVKEFSWWNQTFSVDVPGPDDYTVRGSFWERAYVFERGGEIVASASKALWTWADTYGLEIEPGADAVTILATAVIIDLVLHDEG